MISTSTYYLFYPQLPISYFLLKRIPSPFIYSFTQFMIISFKQHQLSLVFDVIIIQRTFNSIIKIYKDSYLSITIILIINEVTVTLYSVNHFV